MYFKAVLVKNEVVTTRPFDALLSLTSAMELFDDRLADLAIKDCSSCTAPVSIRVRNRGRVCKNVNTTVLAAWPKPNFVSHFG